MTGAQYAGLSSAALGAIGTTALFFSSYALQPLEGGVFWKRRLNRAQQSYSSQQFRPSSSAKDRLCVPVRELHYSSNRLLLMIANQNIGYLEEARCSRVPSGRLVVASILLPGRCLNSIFTTRSREAP
jgi:hypothetical protein